MIVPSMNTHELVKEIFLDLPMVERKAEYLLESLRRKAVKSKDKCYYQLFEYKSKRENHWLIATNYFKGQPTFNTLVYYLNEQGLNVIAIGEQHRLYHFSPHFLTRYNERFLKQENISRLDLIKRFMSVNKAGVIEVDDHNNCIFSRFTEGIGLGRLEIIDYQKHIFHLRTFISNQMVFDDQQHSIDMASEYYDIYCREIKKYLGIQSI